MVNRVANKFTDKHVEVHFTINNHDLSICGCDVCGDHDYKGIGIVDKPVNCQDCLELVREIKALELKKKEM